MHTFAAPRASPPDWAQTFNGAVGVCSRVVNLADLSPQTPLPPLYDHVGTDQLVQGGFCIPDVTNAHHLTTYLAGLQKLPAVMPATGTAAKSGS